MTPLGPMALTIAGSDSCGGAGIQADLRAFGAFGVSGATAITALTAQNPGEVRGVVEVDPAFVVLQARTVLDARTVTAIKTGMLASEPLVRAVAAFLRELREGPAPPRLVVDPVMVATSGARLLAEDAGDALRRLLVPLADVITPNLPEAAVLLGVDPAEAPGWTRAEAESAARRLLGLGCGAVLVKGGHGGGDQAADVLATPGGVSWLVAPRVRARTTHGTGCTLSAAIAAGLALGWDLDHAAREAKRYLSGRLELGLDAPPPPFHTTGPGDAP